MDDFFNELLQDATNSSENTQPTKAKSPPPPPPVPPPPVVPLHSFSLVQSPLKPPSKLKPPSPLKPPSQLKPSSPLKPSSQPTSLLDYDFGEDFLGVPKSVPQLFVAPHTPISTDPFLFIAPSATDPLSSTQGSVTNKELAKRLRDQAVAQELQKRDKARNILSKKVHEIVNVENGQRYVHDPTRIATMNQYSLEEAQRRKLHYDLLHMSLDFVRWGKLAGKV